MYFFLKCKIYIVKIMATFFVVHFSMDTFMIKVFKSCIAFFLWQFSLNLIHFGKKNHGWILHYKIIKITTLKKQMVANCSTIAKIFFKNDLRKKRIIINKKNLMCFAIIVFTYIICGEYLVKAFNHAFMSSNFYSSIKQFSREILPNLMEKMKQQYIFVKLILTILIYECLREHIMCLPL
jgi:hypothetical protein